MTVKAFSARLGTGLPDLETKSFPAQEKAFKTLARDGQAPDFMVISCCDSRVLPTVGACADTSTSLASGGRSTRTVRRRRLNIHRKWPIANLCAALSEFDLPLVGAS